MALIVDHSVPTEKNMSIHLRFRLFAARKKRKPTRKAIVIVSTECLETPSAVPSAGGSSRLTRTWEAHRDDVAVAVPKRRTNGRLSVSTLCMCV